MQGTYCEEEGKSLLRQDFPSNTARLAVQSGSAGAFEKGPQLRSRLELRDGIEFLEGGGECIGETPSRPRGEFLDFGVEIQVVDAARQAPGNIQLALDECPVDDQLRGLVWKPGSLPGLDLLPHRVEVPLHAVHSDCLDVHETQVLGVFREHRSERTWDNVAKQDEIGAANAKRRSVLPPMSGV